MTLYSMEMFVSEKCNHRIEKKYSKLERMKVENLNFWDKVLGKQKTGLLSIKIYVSSVSPIDIKKQKPLRKND